MQTRKAAEKYTQKNISASGGSSAPSKGPRDATSLEAGLALCCACSSLPCCSQVKPRMHAAASSWFRFWTTVARGHYFAIIMFVVWHLAFAFVPRCGCHSRPSRARKRPSSTRATSSGCFSSSSSTASTSSIPHRVWGR